MRGYFLFTTALMPVVTGNLPISPFLAYDFFMAMQVSAFYTSSTNKDEFYFSCSHAFLSFPFYSATEPE